jgi:hypothetical protein
MSLTGTRWSRGSWNSLRHAVQYLSLLYLYRQSINEKSARAVIGDMVEEDILASVFALVTPECHVTSQLTAATLPCRVIDMPNSANRLCFHQPATRDSWVYISFLSHVSVQFLFCIVSSRSWASQVPSH